jgi:hypothetical protein
MCSYMALCEGLLITEFQKSEIWSFDSGEDVSVLEEHIASICKNY